MKFTFTTSNILIALAVSFCFTTITIAMLWSSTSDPFGLVVYGTIVAMAFFTGTLLGVSNDR